MKSIQVSNFLSTLKLHFCTLYMVQFTCVLTKIEHHYFLKKKNLITAEIAASGQFSSYSRISYNQIQIPYRTRAKCWFLHRISYFQQQFAQKHLNFTSFTHNLKVSRGPAEISTSNWSWVVMTRRSYWNYKLRVNMLTHE